MMYQKKRTLRKQQNGMFRPFDLQRTFAVFSLICIAAISAATAAVLTRFLSAQLLKRDAVVSMEVIQAVANTEDLEFILSKPDIAALPHEMPEFFTHVASMPDVPPTTPMASTRIQGRQRDWTTGHTCNRPP